MKVSEQLRNSILQAAIQGKLTEQHESDGSAYDLLQEIRSEKEQLIKDKRIKKEKPLAPITEEEIPFDIPENWEWTRLGNIGSWISGSTPSRSNLEYYSNGSIPWLKTGDLNNGIIQEVPEYITEKALKETSLKVLEPGTVLIAMYGATIGKLGILDIAATTNQACCGCTTFSGVLNKYLFYFLLSNKDSFIKQGEGGAQPNISKEKILKTTIPLPPLAEQKRIVERIEELLPEIDKLKEQEEIASKADTELPEKLRKSLLQAAMQGELTEQLKSDGSAIELLQEIKAEKEQLIKEKKIKKEKPLAPITEEEIPFDIPENWSWVRLGDVLSVFTGNSVSASVKNSKYMNNKEGLPYIGTKDVKFDKTIDYDNGVVIPFDEPNFKVIEENTPLLCIEGGSAGRKIGYTNQSVCFGNKLCAFESYSSLINSKYIFYSLQTPEFSSLFSESMSGIIGGVGTTKLKSFIISLPPLSEQNRIVERLDYLLDEIEILDKEM